MLAVASTDELLEALGSRDWATRAAAAEQLREVPGERVTRALARALDADDTAVTEAAVGSLLARDDPLTVDLIWEALSTLDDDLTSHVWFFLSQHPRHPITRELERRYDSQN